MKNILANVFTAYLDSINFEDKSVVEVLKTKDKQFGDYTSNISLRLTKALGKPPMEIAEEIKSFIEENYKEDFNQVTATNPGFVNLFLSEGIVVKEALKFVNENYKPNFETISKQKINYEYVSANPTGDLHIGHARNATVGSIVINALRYLGHEVYTEYYVNDGGKQMQVLAESVYYYFAKKAGIESTLDEEAVAYHGEEIEAFANKLVEDGMVLKGETQEERISELVKISGEHFLNVIKELLKEVNLPEFDQWTSEKKLLETELEPLFNELKEMGAIYEAEGATWIKVEQFGDEKDRVLIKNDGSFTYMVADLANHVNKYKRGFDLLIDLWGKDHHGYEPRIQASMSALGMGGKFEVDYISMVRVMRDGEVVKMSKRAGTSFRVKDIINEMDKDVFRFFLVSKDKEQNLDIDINMAKQQDLSNPFYYVQYANARVAQIINKYKDEVGDINVKDTFTRLGEFEKEKDLMIKMNEFEDVMVSMNNDREPSLLINYLRELTQTFNSYYADQKVITDDKELSEERINLIVALKNQLNTIFNLIGVTPIDKI